MRLLILELDVVEVMLVLVEAVDGDWDVPAALAVHLGHRVDDPLVSRHGDVHAAGLTQIVYVERNILRGVVGVVRRQDAQAQTLIVEAVTDTYLNGLLGYEGRVEVDLRTAGGQWMTVDGNLGTVRVRLVVYEQAERNTGLDSLRLLALVGEIDLEAGSIVDRYTADALLVEADLRVVNLHGALVKYRTGVPYHRRALVLPWVASSTATGTIDEALRTEDSHGHLLLQLFQDVLLLLLELVAHEDSDIVCVVVHLRAWVVGDEFEFFLLFLFIATQVGQCDTIDIHVQMAQLVGNDGEALLAAIGLL